MIGLLTLTGTVFNVIATQRGLKSGLACGHCPGRFLAFLGLIYPEDIGPPSMFLLYWFSFRFQ